MLIAFSVGVFSGGGDTVAGAAAPQPDPAPMPQAEETPGEAVAPGANGKSPAAVPAKAPAVPDGAPVVLTASEDAWIKVYDTSGQTVRMGILKGGESYAVPGDPEQPLLWTGKAGAIRITVGGKPVAPLGQPVQTVRDISLAPGSLLARSAPAADRKS